MPDIVLRFKVEGDQLKVIDDASGKIKDLGRAGDSGGMNLLNFNAAVNLASTALGALKSGLEVASQMNELGREARSADLALSAFSGGKADQYLKAMDTATGGLVDRMTEAKDASFLLSHGIATSSEEIAKITHLGAVLGETMMNSTTAGIDAVDNALEHVGNKRSLYQLAVDVPMVEARFKELKKTLGDEKAWTQAVEEGLGKAVAKVGDNFDKPGAGLDKLNAKLETLKQTVSKPISIVVDFLAGKVLDSNLMKIIDEAAQKAEQAKNLDINPYGPDGMATGDHIPGSAWGAMAGRISGNMQGPTLVGSGLGDTSAQGLNSGGFSSAGAMTPEALEQANATANKALERQKQATAESERYAQAIARGSASWLDAVSMSDAVRGNMEAAVQATMKQHAITSAAIGGMVSGFAGDMSSDSQAARSAREASDRAKGMGKGAIDKDLAGFDKQMQLAMDSYALSTGTATKESLAFRDMQKGISNEFIAGKISAGEYARELTMIGKAAKDSATDINALGRAQEKIMSKEAANTTDKYGKKAGPKGVAAVGLAEAAGGGDYGATSNIGDPYGATVTSAEKATQKVDVLSQHSSAAGGAIYQAGLQGAVGITSLNRHLDDATFKAKALYSAIFKIPQNYDINLNVRGLPGRGPN